MRNGLALVILPVSASRTNFGSLQLVLDPLAVGDFALPKRPFDGVQAGQPVFQFGQARPQGIIFRYELGFRFGWHR
jgi:hypothetical protein